MQQPSKRPGLSQVTVLHYSVMASARLPSGFALARNSWDLLRKHPALNAVIFWLLLLPSAVSQWMEWTYQRSMPAMSDVTCADVLFIVLAILLTLVMIWGSACVLFVGRRMIQNKAGRARSSFTTVRRDAAGYIVPLVLTSLLQLCFLFYWSLIFVIPAVALVILSLCNTGMDGFSGVRDTVTNCGWYLLFLTPLLLPAVFYYFRTFFYNVVAVCEERSPRESLRRSWEMTAGFTLRIFWRLLFLAVVLLLPGQILLQMNADLLADMPHFYFPGSIVAAAVENLGYALFLLGCISLYGVIRDKKENPRKK